MQQLFQVKNNTQPIQPNREKGHNVNGNQERKKH